MCTKVNSEQCILADVTMERVTCIVLIQQAELRIHETACRFTVYTAHCTQKIMLH